MNTPMCIAVAILAVSGSIAIAILPDRPPAPCAAGWVVADKTLMPSPAEQMMSAGSNKLEIEGPVSAFRRKVVLLLTCASDGRYRIETQENP